ncbi:tautomerase family protein [Streptomyces sp. NBC_00212]|uniref:tautomerase family protein n=1 Tax=Streptomyces sp. NBC_00212 TaxID=2975684 RepID=UPI002F9078D7
MPVVTVEWWSGSTVSARTEAVRAITDVVARAAHCPPEAVTVIIRDVDKSFWGKGGTLASEDHEAPSSQAHAARAILPDQL